MWKTLIAAGVLTLLLCGSALAMDLDDVIRMLQAGVSEDVILKAIDADGDHLAITSDDLIDLKEAGASDWFLKEMLDRSNDSQSYSSRYQTAYPYPGYVTLGLVYDPFDYYFAAWPYYYAYVSPFTFGWSGWYYGGPYHRSWWGRWGHRSVYYDRHWGARSIWSHGYAYAAPRSAVVPAYVNLGRNAPRTVYGRPASGTARWGAPPARVWGGRGSGRSSRYGVWQRGGNPSVATPGRTQIWGHPRGYVAPARPEQSHAPAQGNRSSRSVWGR